MTLESKLREKICLLAKSMYERGLTGGNSGNISAKLPGGELLVTPTGSCFGRLDPSKLSKLDTKGKLLNGDKPTKEIPLHKAFYETRTNKTGAVVHLHSCYSVALSTLPNIDPDNMLKAITAYGIMKLGKVALLPYFMPGDPLMGKAVRGLAGKRSAVVLANHGPVVAGKDLDAACYAMEELEETSKLILLTKDMSPNLLSTKQIESLVKTFDIEWD